MSDTEHDPDVRPHADLPETLDEARRELPPLEYERVVQAGEEAAEKATVRESARWILWLLIGASVVAAAVADWRFLIPAAGLMVWYSLPYIIAADSDAADDAEAETVDRALHPERRD